MRNVSDVISELRNLNLSVIPHLGGDLLSHLTGVYKILESWGEDETVLLAGLCHSVYGTQIFTPNSLNFEIRNKIKEIIGEEAERLVFLFCILTRDSFWQNLERTSDFSIRNRFSNEEMSISFVEVKKLLTILLANNLELRPREPLSEKSLYKNFYLKSKKWLSPKAWQQFLIDYEIYKNGNKKILVFGGTLYVGRRLVNHLLAHGFDVTIASRGKHSDFFGSRVERVILDRQDKESILQLRGTEWNSVYDNLCFTPDDADSVCETFSDHVQNYFMISSQAVYSAQGLAHETSFDPATFRWTETKADGANIINNGRIYTGSHIPNWISYGELKRRAEAVLVRKMRSRLVLVRFPMVLGIDDPTRRLRTEIEKMAKGEVISLFEKSVGSAVISADKAAEFLYWLLNSKIQGPVNACSQGLIDCEEVISLSEKFLNVKIKLVRTTSPKHPNLFSKNIPYQLSCSKAESAGFKFDRVSDWLPTLIQQICAEIKRSTSEKLDQSAIQN